MIERGSKAGRTRPARRRVAYFSTGAGDLVFSRRPQPCDRKGDNPGVRRYRCRECFAYKGLADSSTTGASAIETHANPRPRRSSSSPKGCERAAGSASGTSVGWLLRRDHIPSCWEPSHEDIALAGTSRTRRCGTLMPFVDHASSHQRDAVQHADWRDAYRSTRGVRHGVSIVSAATAASGRPGKATGSFNALINATASFCLISGPTARVKPTKNPALAGLSGERLKGLEPSTFCMASRRSSQLSYSRTVPNAGL